jgi:Domain of unknown function (DUF1772)
MMIDYLLAFSNALVLGLFAGSLLLEGLVLVPLWRSLTPHEFFQFHHEFGKRLFSYFAPLTTLAALLPLVFAIAMKGQVWSANIAALASLTVLAFFPMFFRKANDAFANRTILDAELPARLKAWANMHAMRSIIAIVAFGAALVALAK